eukprot:SAG22_NODE_6684_length_823_cov_1.048343_1_plen_150_part_01
MTSQWKAPPTSREPSLVRWPSTALAAALTVWLVTAPLAASVKSDDNASARPPTIALGVNGTDPMYNVFANLLKFNKPIWITELDRRGGSSARSIKGNPLSQPEYLDREIGRLANLSAAHSNVIEAIFIYELYDEPHAWKSPLAIGHGLTC